jgi:hypothetical protein
MSKALTRRNRKFKGDVDPSAQRSFGRERNAHFPSYFGNFGIFSRFLILSLGMAPKKRRPLEKHEFPLITAFMAIV